MVKGVLSKRQRERKKLREMQAFVKASKNAEWKNFVKDANDDPIVELHQDRSYVNTVLKSWREQQQGGS